MSKEAMKLALEALEFDGFTPEDQTHRAYTTKAITALRQALANEALDKMAENAREVGLDYEPAQKPALTDHEGRPLKFWGGKVEQPAPVPEQLAKYVAALVAGTHEITSVSIRPKREWVGLTDEQIKDVAASCMWWVREQDILEDAIEFARAIEAKLKEKNT